jgi:hypothetical protein
MQTSGTGKDSPAPNLALCLHSIMEEGRALISPGPLPDNGHDALAVLEEIAACDRDSLAFELPEFSTEAALWSARLFYQLCQFVALRDIGEDKISAACAVACPAARCPATDWSVDLVLRHLPRLFQMAQNLSNADPLVEHLKQLARNWPLSSVGIASAGELNLDSFIGHPALRRLYADRVESANDASRLGDARVDDVLRADIGIHRELAPFLAARLFPQNT